MSGAGYSVLVIEDDPDFALLLQLNLESANHHVSQVSTMHDALDFLHSADGAVDAVVLDLGLPDADGLDGLQAALENGNTPVIVFTGDARPSLRRQANDIGVAAFLVKGTVTAEDLDATVRAAVNDTQPRPAVRVGFSAFEDDEEAIAAGLEMISAGGGPSRWAYIRFLGDEAVVLVRTGLGNELAPGERVELLGALAEARTARRVHVSDDKPGECVQLPGGVPIHLGHWVAVPIEVDKAEHAMLVGWDKDLLVLDPHTELMLTFVARHLATLQLLTNQRSRATRRADIAGNAASADILTGLGNRRAYDQFVRSEEARCRRYDHPAVVFVIDLDKLKVINDEQGHAAGDRYLRQAAGALVKSVRDSDCVFRVGGDEFTVVAVECDEVGAEQLEKRIRTLLGEAGVEASIGYASRSADRSLEDAAGVADERMYAEKSARPAR